MQTCVPQHVYSYAYMSQTDWTYGLQCHIKTSSLGSTLAGAGSKHKCTWLTKV